MTSNSKRPRAPSSLPSAKRARLVAAVAAAIDAIEHDDDDDEDFLPATQPHQIAQKPPNAKQKAAKRVRKAKAARVAERQNSGEPNVTVNDLHSIQTSGDHNMHGTDSAIQSTSPQVQRDVALDEPTFGATVQPVRSPVPELIGREFSSWDAWFEFFEQFEKENSACYRKRDSRSRENWNREKPRRLHPERCIPSSFEHAFIKYVCTLGCWQKPRGQGKRADKQPRFKGCMASIRVAVVRVGPDLRRSWVIRVTAEHPIHNHQLSPAIFAALKRSRDLIDDRILEQLNAFVATNTDTKQITEYISSQLGLPITSQQIRNMINSRLGNGVAETRLQHLLARFIEPDGNTCLLIQDEWDLTCGIVLQSAAQKALFRQWGDTLVLDWTHNTNNIGFYLGSLVVTTATGRGASVVDFLCLNRRKETLKAVIEHFKSLNPTWTQVKSVVIDKDFAEWSALEAVFPGCKVFLCQFHALRHFRLVMGGKAQFVPLAHRDEMESLFRGLVYAPTLDSYVVAKRAFITSGNVKAKRLTQYFLKNWDNCSTMWSNYGRRSYFSAGNTTTNRIESNWNQFKQLLGKKTSIDKCVRVILQHQVCVMRQLLRAMAHFELQSPVSLPLPRELQPLAAVLSLFCLKRVWRQWDLHVMHGQDWTWDISTEQEVTLYTATPKTTTYTVICVQGEMSCDCLFNVSTMLPCRHIMNVMLKCVGETEVKVAQLPARWSMVEAGKVEVALNDSILHLSRVRGATVDSDDQAPVLLPRKGKKVGYVKLARRQKCDQVVQSSCEKYNVVYAELTPVIEALQRLPSHQFYKPFSELRDLVSGFMSKWGLATAVDDDVSDEELDIDSVLDDADDEIISTSIVHQTFQHEADQDAINALGENCEGDEHLAEDNARDGSGTQEHEFGDHNVDGSDCSESECDESDRGRRANAQTTGVANVQIADVAEVAEEHQSDEKEAEIAEKPDVAEEPEPDKLLGVIKEPASKEPRAGDPAENIGADKHTEDDRQENGSRTSFDRNNEGHTTSRHDQIFGVIGRGAVSHNTSLQQPGEQESGTTEATTAVGEIVGQESVLRSGRSTHVDPSNDAQPEEEPNADVNDGVQDFGFSLSAECVEFPSQVSLPELSMSELSQKQIAEQAQQNIKLLDRNLALAEQMVADDGAGKVLQAALRRVKRTVRPTSTANRGKGAISQLARKMKRREQLLSMVLDSDEDPEQYNDVGVSSSDESDESDSDFQCSDTEVAQLPKTRSRLSILRLPPALPRTSTAKAPRTRRGVIITSNDCPIRVDQITLWASQVANMERALRVMDAYPVVLQERILLQKNPTVIEQRGRVVDFMYTFVVPRDLLGRVNTALHRWSDEQGQNIVSSQYSTFPVVFISSDLVGLSIDYISEVKRFYDIKDMIPQLLVDFAWVKRDWSTSPGLSVSFMSFNQAPPSHLCGEVAQLLLKSGLDTKFTQPCRPSRIVGGSRTSVTVTLQQVIGRLAGDTRLNDAVMDWALQSMSTRFAGCFAMDPLAVSQGVGVFPDTPLLAHRIVIVPLCKAAHWVIQIVEIETGDDANSQPNITAWMYNPLGGALMLNKLWTEFTLPTLQAWYRRDCSNRSRELTTSPNDSNDGDTTLADSDRPLPFPIKTAPVLGPRQHDHISCGMYCLAIAYSFADGTRSLENGEDVKGPQVDLMRLRLLTDILRHHAGEANEHAQTWVPAADIGKRIKHYFKV